MGTKKLEHVRVGKIVTDINPYHLPCFLKTAFEKHALFILQHCDNLQECKTCDFGTDSMENWGLETHKSVAYKHKMSWLEDYHDAILSSNQSSGFDHFAKPLGPWPTNIPIGPQQLSDTGVVKSQNAPSSTQMAFNEDLFAVCDRPSSAATSCSKDSPPTLGPRNKRTTIRRPTMTQTSSAVRSNANHYIMRSNPGTGKQVISTKLASSKSIKSKLITSDMKLTKSSNQRSSN